MTAIPFVIPATRIRLDGPPLPKQDGNAESGTGAPASKARDAWLLPVILSLVVYKIAYLVLIGVFIRFAPDWEEAAMSRYLSPAEAVGFAGHWRTWDADHYLRLSRSGYAKGAVSCAFYPLWPLTIRAASGASGLDPLVCAMVLTNCFSLAAWTLFYHTAARRWGSRTALTALTLLIIFPGSLFYQFVYSESEFFLLAMLLWRRLEFSSYRLAWAAAFLLPLARGAGLFAVLPIFAHWLANGGFAAGSPFRPAVRPIDEAGPQKADGDRRRPWRPFLLMAAPPLGFSLYAGLMWFWTGNPFEGFAAQQYWGVHSIGNLWNAPKFVLGFFHPITLAGFNGSLLDRVSFLLLIVVWPVIRRLGAKMTARVWMLAVLPAMSGTFVSFTRYESTAFPVFLGMAVFFQEKKSWKPVFAGCALMLWLHDVLVWRFVNYRWAG
jgi:hypothetical protein